MWANKSPCVADSSGRCRLVDFELDAEQRAWLAEVHHFLEDTVTDALRAEIAEHGLERQCGQRGSSGVAASKRHSSDRSAVPSAAAEVSLGGGQSRHDRPGPA
jgi:hypothetical protein